MLITREDSFRGTRIHTIAWMLFDSACWCASEIGAALDADAFHFGSGWIEEVDYALLDGEDAFELYEALGKTTPAERPLPALILFPSGLTLACLDHAGGWELRRLLLGGAAEAAMEELGRTRLERELHIVYRDEELEDRARKARALHRAVEAVRRSGYLASDDAGYADCMASIAEIATGLRFPTRSQGDHAAPGGVDNVNNKDGISPEI